MHENRGFRVDSAEWAAWLWPLLWGSAIVVSLVGWGEIVAVWLRPPRRPDWALSAAWGTIPFTTLAGVACAIHASSRRLLVAEVIVGVGIFAWRRGRGRWRVRSRAWRLARANALPWIVAAVAYAIAAWGVVCLVDWQKWNGADDQPLYFLLAKKVLEQGSLVDPYDVRRISTFGGHTVLQAAYAALVPFHCLNALEPGIFTLLLVGLAVGAFTTRALRPWHALPMAAACALALSLIAVQSNSASMTSGAFAFLAIHRTLRLFARAHDDPRWPAPPRLLVVLGLLAATCTTLRTSNAIPAVAFVALAIVARSLAQRGKQPFSRAIGPLARAALLASAAYAAALVPWAASMHESCGTFFFPALGSGRITRGFEFFRLVASLHQAWTALRENFLFERPIAGIPLFMLAGLFAAERRCRFDLVAMTLASALGAVVLVLVGHRFGPDALVRYYFAYVVALSVAVVASPPRPRASGPRRAWIQLALVVLGLAWHGARGGRFTAERYREYAQTARHLLARGSRASSSWQRKDELYASLQAQMNPGARVVVAVDEPFRFDCARNEIFSLDFAGGIGPAPGFPAFQGPRAFDRYLREHGVRYLVFADFTGASVLYTWAGWEQAGQWKDRYLSGQAPFVLDVMGSILVLWRQKARVAERGGITILDLERDLP